MIQEVEEESESFEMIVLPLPLESMQVTVLFSSGCLFIVRFVTVLVKS